MAEGIFLNLIKEKGLTDKWTADSAAVISLHVGKSPDKRTMTTLASHGITDYKHIVRQVYFDSFCLFLFYFL